MSKREKIEKRNKIIIGVVLSLFMLSSLGSVILYYGNSESDTNKFTLDLSNGKYQFVRKQDSVGNLYYEVSSENTGFNVFYVPEQLNTIEISQDTINQIKNSYYFYLTFDPEESDLTSIDYLRFDLKNNIPQTKYFQDAVTKSSDIYNLPIITCQNATFQTPVIILKQGNSTNITSANNCINLEFEQYQLLHVRDLLVYLMHGIDIDQVN